MTPRPFNEDSDCLARARAGDAGAFGQLVTLHQRGVYAFLLGQVRSPDTADELTQNTFLRAWKSLSGFRGESRFQTWLFQIALNQARSWARWHRLRQWREAAWDHGDDPEIPESDVADPSGGAQPDHALNRDEEGARMRRAIDQLPPREKEVFLLRHDRDLPLKQIAEILGLAEGSVKAHLFHAMQKLRKALEPL